MKQISIETKTSTINRFNNGESVSELTEATGVARSTIYGWIKAAQSDSENKPVNRKTVNDLESKVIRLSTLIEILQKVFDVENLPTRIRLEELEKLYGDYNVHNLCDALMVPRGTLYNHIKRNKRDNSWYAQRRENLREQIQEIYDDNRQVFGSPKVTAVLKSRGVSVSEEMVRRLMQDMGLISIRESAKNIEAAIDLCHPLNIADDHFGCQSAGSRLVPVPAFHRPDHRRLDQYDHFPVAAGWPCAYGHRYYR